MITNIIKKEVDGTHFYYVDEKFLPSVSRILDVASPKEYGLLNFYKINTPDQIEQISNEAKGNGTLVHDACEILLRGDVLELKNYDVKAKKAIISFYEWFKTFKPSKFLIEFTVASLKKGYAGTLDLKCTLNGKTVIIDFKTNKSGIYFSNKLQIMAYKQAYEETTEEHIDECYVLRLGTTHKCGYEFKLIDDTTVDDFNHVYQTYLRMNGGKIEEPPMIDVYPPTLKLDINWDGK